MTDTSTGIVLIPDILAAVPAGIFFIISASAAGYRGYQPKNINTDLFNEESYTGKSVRYISLYRSLFMDQTEPVVWDAGT